MGMCIPGAKQKLCSDCIKEASEQLIQTCPKQTSALHWSGGGETLCMARYSNQPSFRPLDIDQSSIGSNVGDLRTNITAFNIILKRLVGRMINEASSSSSGDDKSVSNSRFYLADVAALTSSQMVYALVQCTPDVSPSSCKTCLRRSVVAYNSCCLGKQGGYVYWPNCIFRWDLYPFNGAFDLLTIVPPPTLTNKDGKTIQTGAIIGIVAATVIAISLLALGAAVCRRRKKYQAFASGSEFLMLFQERGETEFKNVVLLVAKLQH
uniref:Putative cysteine-rich receptor-like protein kinase 30 n=1 Tax=Noccaea caerulescens TaxID=107243 RepID=A0A1J3H087_NOCCA